MPASVGFVLNAKPNSPIPIANFHREAIALGSSIAGMGAVMRNLNGSTLMSATDLMRFMGCAHATTLDLAYMRGTGPTCLKLGECAFVSSVATDTQLLRTPFVH